MTPRSRKPVMVTMFNNLDQKYQANISQLLEEDEMPNDCDSSTQEMPVPLIPISVMPPVAGDEVANTSLNGANDNGLPVAETGSSSSGSLSSAFKYVCCFQKFKSFCIYLVSICRDYLSSRGHRTNENNHHQDDYSFSSQSDDFDSSNEESNEMDIEKVINQSSLSKSMLHCLDGKDASLLSANSSSRKRHLEEDDNVREESSSESIKRQLIENDLTDF
jgi:hypothetical protein